ncbi:MAG: tRNA (adenosine(37)-N6)-threonylcarbamoyltransferase complex transferase subunit TsaD, partial [Candidatus Omnitrophica bacterium]|nr:tRNA (adenosine(37)-N6)-threonylcarbamoyltransferase complex transferase subunit TsaD [Candidatus Omnitrophota bacterium]
SGGHTSLYYFKNFDKYAVLGETLDDAAGEAFDKVAKLLKLGYPGGPFIEKIARCGNHKAYDFKCGNNDNLNFSFSGIKTAVLYKIKDINKQGILTKKQKSALAASFQHAVITSLIDKTILAVLRKKVKTLVVGGGVAANKYFRKKLHKQASKEGIKVFIAKDKLCTDNASMVAGLGYQLYRLGKCDNLNFKPILY